MESPRRVTKIAHAVCTLTIEGRSACIAIALRDRQLFAFAGLWENWKDPSSRQWVRTFTILTTKPNELVAALHYRMPLILAPADCNRWLDPSPAQFLRPPPLPPPAKSIDF